MSKNLNIETNTLTCVYTINDAEQFEKEKARIMENFKQSKNEPWAITAISIGHEIHRLDLIEEAHAQNRHDLLNDIFGIIDPTKIDSISQLASF